MVLLAHSQLSVVCGQCFSCTKQRSSSDTTRVFLGISANCLHFSSLVLTLACRFFYPRVNHICFPSEFFPDCVIMPHHFSQCAVFEAIFVQQNEIKVPGVSFVNSLCLLPRISYFGVPGRKALCRLLCLISS